MDINADIIELIASKLESKDVVNFRSVNKIIYNIVTPYINKNLIIRVNNNTYYKYKNECIAYISHRLDDTIFDYVIRIQNDELHGISLYRPIYPYRISDTELCTFRNGELIQKIIDDIIHYRKFIIQFDYKHVDIIKGLDDVEIEFVLQKHEINYIKFTKRSKRFYDNKFHRYVNIIKLNIHS